MMCQLKSNSSVNLPNVLQNISFRIETLVGSRIDQNCQMGKFEGPLEELGDLEEQFGLDNGRNLDDDST